MKNSIASRATTILNLKQYNELNYPERVVGMELAPPSERQYILRMMIKKGHNEIQLPEEYKWCKPMIDASVAYQKDVIGINHSFIYLTIRHGEVSSIDDDVWHVDGFSMRINHIPEQNYLWTDVKPTEFTAWATDLSNFDPFSENIHLKFQKEVDELATSTMKEKMIYCLDPYVIHRRPKMTEKIQRTFVRLSFTPIEINDVNNTINPLMPIQSDYDGIKAFRSSLK